MKRTRATVLALAALAAFGMLGGVAAAEEEPPLCPDRQVGPLVHAAEEPFQGTPAAEAAELILHDTAEPVACELLP